MLKKNNNVKILIGLEISYLVLLTINIVLLKNNGTCI